MQHFLQVLGLLLLSCQGLQAQNSSVDLVISRQPVAGIVLSDTEAPILYQGGFDAADNGQLVPVQLDATQAVATLVPFVNGPNPMEASATLASWFDQATGKEYILESSYDCNVVITEAALHSYDPNDPSQVDVIPVPNLFLSDNPETGLAVNGNLYVILRDDYIIAGNLSDPLNVIRHDLAIALPKIGMQRFATTSNGSIHVADRNTIYTFSSRNAPVVQTFTEELLGLGVTANDELIAFSQIAIHVVDVNGQTETFAHNQAGNTFSSFAIAPQHNSFICTYFTPTGDELIGIGQFENGQVTIAQSRAVDANNREFCEKFAVKGNRQLGVIGFHDHDTRLVVYSETGGLTIGNTIPVTLTTAEVEASVSIVAGGDTTVSQITYTPVVTNTSDVVIERLDFDASKLRPWYCRTSSGLFYEDLSLQPGETRQLAPITIFGFDYLPAPNAEVTLQLNAANNFPISPDVSCTYTEYPLLVGTSSAFAKTLAVWPNPVSDVLHVDASTLSGIRSVLVSDVLGKTHALPFENGQVNVAQLPKGYYALVLIDDRGDAARSVFVKQ